MTLVKAKRGGNTWKEWPLEKCKSSRPSAYSSRGLRKEPLQEKRVLTLTSAFVISKVSPYSDADDIHFISKISYRKPLNATFVKTLSSRIASKDIPFSMKMLGFGTNE